MKKYVLLILFVACVLFFLYYKGVLFSIFQPNVIYQGKGQVPTNLQIDNQILDFDKNEKSFTWSFDMSGQYTAGCCDTYCSYDRKQVKYWWVVKIDGKVVDRGTSYQDLSGCSGSSQTINWKTTGTVKLPDDMQIGRHYLEVIVATLPVKPWTTSAAYWYNGCLDKDYWFTSTITNCTLYTSGSCSGFCNPDASKCLSGDYDVSFTEYRALLKKCGYHTCLGTSEDAIYDDLANGYVCKNAVDIVYDKCTNTYINNCDKCGVNKTECVTVWSSNTGCRGNNCPGGGYNLCLSNTQVYCPYDQCTCCVDIFGSITCGSVSKGANLCSMNIGGYSWACSYVCSCSGCNYQTTCNNCTIEEPCNPRPVINTSKENIYRSKFTITSLTKDFVVCKGGQCVLQVQCTKDSDCSTPCDGVACYCGNDNYCHCSGTCITRPPQQLGLWSEIQKAWGSFWAWILSKLGWL
jgi:hypothetical protein